MESQTPPPTTPVDRIPWKIGSGFVLILGLCWLMEFLEVPHRFFGEAAGFNWPRVLLRTTVLLGVWCWMHYTIKRLLTRLHHLEEFLLLCSWCRKIGHQGQWHTTEEYFGKRFDTETSHGICPTCAQQQRDELARCLKFPGGGAAEAASPAERDDLATPRSAPLPLTRRAQPNQARARD
jgi:hypothetical protein